MAEAFAAFKSGATWWLDPADQSIINDAREEQAARYDADPWQSLIVKYVQGHDEVTTDTILSDCLRKPKEDWHRRDQMRIGACLKALGWVRFRKRLPTGLLEWRFKCASTT